MILVKSYLVPGKSSGNIKYYGFLVFLLVVPVVIMAVEQEMAVGVISLETISHPLPDLKTFGD